MDSDYLSDLNYLEKQPVFIKERVPLISSGYRRKAKHTLIDCLVPETVDYKTALRGNPLSCLTTIYDRSVIGKAYFPEDIDRPEDYVFWFNILRRGLLLEVIL